MLFKKTKLLASLIKILTLAKGCLFEKHFILFSKKDILKFFIFIIYYTKRVLTDGKQLKLKLELFTIKVFSRFDFKLILPRFQ